jgi:hypothetical protein
LRCQEKETTTTDGLLSKTRTLRNDTGKSDVERFIGIGTYHHSLNRYVAIDGKKNEENDFCDLFRVFPEEVFCFRNPPKKLNRTVTHTPGFRKAIPYSSTGTAMLPARRGRNIFKIMTLERRYVHER